MMTDLFLLSFLVFLAPIKLLGHVGTCAYYFRVVF
jgi:hypothetical protein